MAWGKGKDPLQYQEVSFRNGARLGKDHAKADIVAWCKSPIHKILTIKPIPAWNIHDCSILSFDYCHAGKSTAIFTHCILLVPFFFLNC